MKRIIFSLLLISLSQYSFAGELEQGKDGTFEQTIVVSSIVFTYIADTKTRLCFVGHSRSISSISCEALAKRQDWAPIITWVK